jgi:hypothetical protein
VSSRAEARRRVHHTLRPAATAVVIAGFGQRKAGWAPGGLKADKEAEW